MATLYESIEQFQFLEKEALHFESKSISYKELITNVKKMVNYFKKLGIKKNDIVTLVLPNIPTCIYSFYALNAIGAIQNIMHPLIPFSEIIESMNKTKSKVLITLGISIDKIKAYDNPNNFIFLIANPYYDRSLFHRHIFYLKYRKQIKNKNIFSLDDFRKYQDRVDISSHDSTKNSIYLHSGGTTGNSKIICLSDDAINNLAVKVEMIVENKRLIKMLAVLPIFHGFGLGMGVHAPLANGASSTLMIKFNAKKIAKYINHHEVNYIIGIPRLYEKLLENKQFRNSKLKYLNACFVGGDNVPVRLINDFNDFMIKHNSKAELLEGYGLTETVTVAFVNTKNNKKIGSVGKPLPGIKVKILSDDMKEIQRNEVGEIFISSNTLMNEYFQDLQTTNETLLRLDNKLWVKTGDMGYIDDDGYLFIKGRKKRIIIISGFNVYPNEIEKATMDLKEVANAVVIYFENDKPHMNLYVIKDPSYDISDNELSKLIMTTLENKFIKYSIPSKIVFMDSFPRTKMGKIDQSEFIDKINEIN